MKYVVPVMVKNPRFQRLWIDPNDPLEVDEFGDIRPPDICTPYVLEQREFETKEEMETFLKK
jgi:hypothetical protein